MKWFKHSVNASRENYARCILRDYGYQGLGIFWCIVERVNETDGNITIEELEKEFNRRHFSRDKVRSLVLNCGYFGVLNTETACANKIYTLDKEKNRKEKTTSKETENRIATLLCEAADEKEKSFYQQMMSEYPRICQMKKPLTYVEMKRLLARYPQDTVISILKGMENLPSLHKRFLSANLTVHSWVSARKRRMQGLEEQ